MAIDKLVDSSQLDNNLTLVANAIRTKGGTSASLSFPTDFVTAINAISSGGSETTYETIVPLQTINCAIGLGNGVYGGYINPYTSFTEEGEKYRVIFDGTTYEPLTATYYGSGTNYLYVGDPNVEVSSSTTLVYPFVIMLYNGQAFYLAVKGSGSHTLQVDKITSEGGGGSATLITKTITANGTYSAEDDDADGYSSVIVNVSGSSSNVYPDAEGSYISLSPYNP